MAQNKFIEGLFYISNSFSSLKQLPKNTCNENRVLLILIR